MKLQIRNGQLYLPDYQFHPGILEINDEHITNIHFPTSETDISTETDCIVLDADDSYVIPGLIDIHFHGCFGADFCDGTIDSLQTIAAYEASQGITGICPASMTLPENELLKIMENAHAFTNSQAFAGSHAFSDFLGIHLEGPFLSAQKCGAQDASFLHKPDTALFYRLQKKSNGLIRIVDIAPEMKDAFSFIRSISTNPTLKCKVSLAHTAADYTTCQNAFTAGASHVTHLYNAMPEFHHRNPGLIGASYDTPACDVELICDGIHVNESAIRMTFQLFTEERIILISDSMRATGMPDGQYTLGGQTVNVSNHLATLTDGTIAGSVTNLMDCVRRAVSFGIPLESAVRCATANPARSIGMDDRIGYLKPGYLANVVILNQDLSLKHVILHGMIII